MESEIELFMSGYLGLNLPFRQCFGLLKQEKVQKIKFIKDKVPLQ